MSEPVKLGFMNDVLGSGGNTNTCDLPIMRGETDGIPFVTSAWKLTAAELEMVNRTGIVLLTVVGTTHPPVSIASLQVDTGHESIDTEGNN